MMANDQNITGRPDRLSATGNPVSYTQTAPGRKRLLEHEIPPPPQKSAFRRALPYLIPGAVVGGGATFSLFNVL